MDERDGLQLRLRQEAQRADRTGRPAPGRFIALAEEPMARHEAKALGLEAAFDGGWPAADRVQTCFYPPEEEPAFTRVWLKISWNARFAEVRHGDLYGSLMALGYDRGYFGDLVLQDGCAWLCTLPEIAPRICEAWTQAGRAAIRVEQPEETPELREPEGELIRDTVPSLRLDCVVAAGMKLSRARAAEAIRQGRVSVDHLPEERTDALLKAGSLVSVRQFGRIRLKEVGEATRKDRLPVLLERFTRKTN